MTADRLAVRHLDKSYAAPVLEDVSLSLARGEVHGIVGENGAGKSTLVNILAGLVPKDGGEILLDGEAYAPGNAGDAFTAGVSLAAQELSTIDTLSVAENIGLRQLPARRGVIDRGSLLRTAQTFAAIVGLDARKADMAVGRLSIADRQLVELAKAFSGDARLLLFDEPTAALTSPQADHLHRLIRERASAGASVIYISHRLRDVLDIADTVSVLRDGKLVRSAPAASFTVDKLVVAMAGDVFHRHERRQQDTRPGAALIRVESITSAELPEPLSLTGHASEIIGIAGLAGAGRSELLQAIFGLAPLTGGRVLRVVAGEDLSVESASHAVGLGLALLGEDRQSQGLFRGLTLGTNMMLPGRRDDASPFKLIDRRREAAAADTLIRKLDIRCRGRGQDIGELSGGNQQKALIGRWLHRDSDVLLLDEPTRGVDVGTKAAIVELLFELRDQGKCILLTSSEIEELMTVCSRILVLSGRRLVCEFDAQACSDTDILAAAFEAHTRDAADH